MTKKIWKQKIIKRVYKHEHSERIWQKVIWERGEEAEKKRDRELRRAEKRKKVPLIEKPINPDKPKVIRRKRKPDNSGSNPLSV